MVSNNRSLTNLKDGLSNLLNLTRQDFYVRLVDEKKQQRKQWRPCRPHLISQVLIKELKQTTTTTATRTSPDKRFNEQNNSCARAL